METRPEKNFLPHFSFDSLSRVRRRRFIAADKKAMCNKWT
jgi:hypothetical protein